MDNSQTGTGIGLNYTKALVETHGGDITVDSEYGKGTTFKVTLPVHSSAIDKAIKSNKKVRSNIKEFDKTMVRSLEYDLSVSEFENQKEHITPDSISQKILVVEDNHELRKHLKNELSPFYKVKEAVNGVEGLAKARKIYPDIIISDVMMPEMDGFEMCSKLKLDPETSHVPIILLTARSLEEDRLEGYSIGADAYLQKPFNITVLKVRIKNLLDARKKLRDKFMDMTIIPSSTEVTTNTFDEQFLDKATSAILENLDDSDFGIEEILEIMGVSRSHFYRKIQSITGQNPSKFIRTVRLKYAAELLKQNNLSIKEISFEVGFNSTAYFSKTFKELFGTTPNQFQQENLKN